MKPSLILVGLATVLLLSACGKQDVPTACYKNGPHESMSDGRIISMCDCVKEKVEAQELNEKQTNWVITLLKGKQVKEELTDTEKNQLRGISMRLSDIQGQCMAAAKAR